MSPISEFEMEERSIEPTEDADQPNKRSENGSTFYVKREKIEQMIKNTITTTSTAMNSCCYTLSVRYCLTRGLGIPL